MKSCNGPSIALFSMLAGLTALAMFIGLNRLPSGRIAGAAEEGSESAPPAAEQSTAENQALSPEQKAAALEADVTQGALRVVAEDGTVVECPLEHTDVQAEISGFVARVKVTQTFHNPTSDKIEAIYVFPLPHEAAVDDMTMLIGERRIVGVIKRRDEARAIYQQALSAGQAAALLEQERPNIFTQSVGNLEPCQDVKIEISYVDVLRYDAGVYEFQFPMVVGPRYNPGIPTGTARANPQELVGKVSPPPTGTTRVPDAARISPPVLKPGYRTGHDVSLAVSLDAGVPVQALKVANHKADIERGGDNRAVVKLSPEDSLPNKDFVLRYGVVGQKPSMAVLAHTGQYSDSRALGNGYFLLMIQPQEDERLTKSPPREVVFLIDVSGSMSGEPTAKVIEAMQHMLKLCRPQDTVQVITFAGHAQKLFEKPVPVNEQNIGKALNFTEGLQGSGDTEMLKGVKLAIDELVDQERVRIVVMLTDGYIGNEAEIIEHVGLHCGDQVRFWCIGIGQSPNMFLVDGVAKQGGGMGKNLGLRDDSQALAQEVMTRIQRAQLAKIRIDWGGLAVSETYPARIPELWAGRPVILFGRYSGGGHETLITVSGSVEGEAVSWPLPITLPADEPGHDVLAKVWARKKIEDLMQQTYYHGSPAVEEAVTAIALDYRLMSPYTSFVAVDESQAVQLAEAARPPRRMLVPVPLPEGTRWEGFFGPEGDFSDRGRLALGAVEEKKDSRTYLQQNLNLLNPPAPRARERSGRARDKERLPARLGRMSGYVPEIRQQAAPQMSLFSRSQVAGSVIADSGFHTADGAAPAAGIVARGNRAFRAAERELLLEDEAQYTTAALSTEAEPILKAAQESLASGQKLDQNGKRSAARTAYLRAYFLDMAAANVGFSGGEVAAESLAAIEQLRGRKVKAWIEQAPQLGKKLDLILRDKSIDEALTTVAEAASVKIKLLPGSIADAAALLGEREARVSFLDLRHATVAQTLDWILLPARMSWWLVKGEIVAGTERRGGAVSAWVYDVSLIALPSADEVDKSQEYEKLVATTKQSADGFMKVVRASLKADEQSVLWFAAGQVLVIGDRQTHSKAMALFTSLADPRASLDGGAGELHKLTSKRAQQRKDAAGRLADVRRRLAVANIHDAFGWQLLSAAAKGDLDIEALTELEIAWSAPETAGLLAGDGRALALRSLWIVTEAARALPDETALGELAKTAVRKSRQAVSDSLAALEKSPDDVAAFSSVLYAVLALRDDADVVASARPLLTANVENSPLASARTLARSLLGEPSGIDSQALADLVAAGVSGEDMVVLAALACRRAGGDAWDAFRAQSSTLLGDQPLPGSVVVLVNHLAVPQLELAAGQAPARR